MLDESRRKPEGDFVLHFNYQQALGILYSRPWYFYGISRLPWARGEPTALNAESEVRQHLPQVDLSILEP